MGISRPNQFGNILLLPKDLLEELFPMVALLNTPGRKSESVNKKFVFLLNSSQLPLT